MSTAVIMTGQARSFATCLPNLNWMVFRHLKDPQFFVSVADDAQAADMHLLEGLYPDRVFIEKVKQPEIPEPHVKHAKHAPYAISSTPQAILRQLWALNRGWDFMQETQEKRTGSANAECGFDTFVRCRPDSWFHRFEMPPWHRQSKSGVRYLDGPVGGIAYIPWWSGCGGVNDRFAIMDEQAAVNYFKAFQKYRTFLDLGCPLHPESIIKEALATGGVFIRPLQATFSKQRMDGTREEPLQYHGELAAALAAEA